LILRIKIGNRTLDGMQGVLSRGAAFLAVVFVSAMTLI